MLQIPPLSNYPRPQKRIGGSKTSANLKRRVNPYPAQRQPKQSIIQSMRVTAALSKPARRGTIGAGQVYSTLPHTSTHFSPRRGVTPTAINIIISPSLPDNLLQGPPPPNPRPSPSLTSHEPQIAVCFGLALPQQFGITNVIRHYGGSNQQEQSGSWGVAAGGRGWGGGVGEGGGGMGNVGGRGGIVYYQNRLQVKEMGLECAKMVQCGGRVVPGERTENQLHQLRENKEVVTFQIKISQLKVVHLAQNFQTLRIDYFQDDHMAIPFTDFTFQQNSFLTKQTYSAEFTTRMDQLEDKYVNFSLEDRTGKRLDRLRLKLQHLSTGPVRHDHLLKQLKSRLLFELHIDQYLTADVRVDSVELTPHPLSPPCDYAYSLALISNSNSPIEATKKYEKHEKIKPLAIEMTKIRNSHLKEAILRFKITSNTHGAWNNEQFEIFIPYAKLQQQPGFKTVRVEGVVYEVRELKVSEVLRLKGEAVGEIAFNIVFMRTRLYAEQMDCVIFSENGIVLTPPSDSSLTHPQQKTLDWRLLSTFDKRIKSVKTYGMGEYQFYRLLQQIYTSLIGKEFNLTDELFKTQQLLLSLMQQLTDLLEQGKQLKNQYIWNILNDICRKEVLTLKYFSSIKNEESKKVFALRFYRVVVRSLCRIMEFTGNKGVTFKDVLAIHRFVAFVYFRFPWLQREIVQTLAKESDVPISEEKLAEIGASYALKSPSKSYFYDWETSVYKLVRRQPEFQQCLQQLQKTKSQNPKWATLLFDRKFEQLFYGLFSQLWDEAFIFLNNGGRIMWQYFPYYGEFLSMFIGEMNSSGILEFSKEMAKCNMKLIKNQKLLNTFMMQIFPKTCLYELSSVMKCLDLIKCYFEVIRNNNKKLPHDFHYNYFYIGIKCILESNHSLLLQKMLALVYKFYHIFCDDFKETINHYILNKVFYQLFMHWSQDVRSIFHLLLIYKVFEYQAMENPEINFKKAKIDFEKYQSKHYYETLIEEMYELKESQEEERKQKSQPKVYFERMRAKLREKGLAKREESTSIAECENFSEFATPRKRSMQASTPLLSRRKWSLAQNLQQVKMQPTEQELKYLQSSLRQFQLAKLQISPDDRVQARSKMLQVIIDQ